MNGTRAQSWNDLVVMTPMDPRAIISSLAFEDQSGTLQNAAFARSLNWLNAGTTWIAPPMKTTAGGIPATTSHIVAANAYDYQAVVDATNWNNLHAMTLPSLGLPLSVQNIMFLRGDPRFINYLYLDFNAGVTSADILFSMRDNSTTSGQFQGNANGTVPVFQFPNSTYGGGGRNLQVSLNTTGRFQVALRIVDNSGNWSMFEMEWIVI
ncbi:MAG TPA: hypothetical protein VFH95_03815 [Candidatus Kapabacteria bacterium]|nr:hypothetical protein [Candidatus Kapabacteria bacterium]